MRRTYSLTTLSLLIIAIVVINSLNPATIGSEAQSPYTINEFTVATGSAVQTHPTISGDIVVWEEQPGGFAGNHW